MGTGEATRYLAHYESAKVDRAVLIGPIRPCLAQAPDNLFDNYIGSSCPLPIKNPHLA
jgi:hypothetical protein